MSFHTKEFLLSKSHCSAYLPGGWSKFFLFFFFIWIYFSPLYSLQRWRINNNVEQIEKAKIALCGQVCTAKLNCRIKANNWTRETKRRYCYCIRPKKWPYFFSFLCHLRSIQWNEGNYFGYIKHLTRALEYPRVFFVFAVDEWIYLYICILRRKEWTRMTVVIKYLWWIKINDYPQVVWKGRRMLVLFIFKNKYTVDTSVFTYICSKDISIFFWNFEINPECVCMCVCDITHIFLYGICLWEYRAQERFYLSHLQWSF